MMLEKEENTDMDGPDHLPRTMSAREAEFCSTDTKSTHVGSFIFTDGHYHCNSCPYATKNEKEFREHLFKHIHHCEDIESCIHFNVDNHGRRSEGCDFVNVIMNILESQRKNGPAGYARLLENIGKTNASTAN